VAEDLNPRAAERLVRAARAAHTLSETLWEALHEQLISPADGERAAALSRRLADVAATVTLLAGEERAQEASTPAAEAASSVERSVPPVERSVPPVERAAPIRSTKPETAVEAGDGGEDVAAPLGSPPAGFSQQSPAMLIDELAPLESHPGVSAGEPSSAPPGEPPRLVELAPAPGSDHEVPEIEVRDERAEHAPSVWVAAIERRLERHRRDREPFAVMAIELVDIERLRHAELPGEVARLTSLVETALAGELRPADSLMRESPGRYWLLAPETDSDGARALAARLDAAVDGAASHRGAPLRVAVGIATCPADGLAAGTLAAHADVALYAARAAGRPPAP